MLSEIETSGDPERGLELAERIHHYWGGRITLPDGLYDSDLHHAVLHHKRTYSELESSGLLGAHAALWRTAVCSLTDLIAARMPMDRCEVLAIDVRYDAASLLEVRLDATSTTVSATWTARSENDSWLFDDIPNTCGVLDAEPGHVRLYLLPGRYSYQRFENGQWVATTGSWADRIQWVVESAVGLLSEQVLDLRFGE